MKPLRKPRKRSPYPSKEEWSERFASLLVVRMESLKIDQCELAKRCEISQQAVSHYVHCRRTPSAYTLFKICIVLGVSPDYFMM